MTQHWFIYNGKAKWTRDEPEEIRDTNGRFTTDISFRAVIGQAGMTGAKTHIGTATVIGFDDGQLHLWSVHASCAAGTASRGGCSGSRDVYGLSLSGTHRLTCGHKMCKNWDDDGNGVNLDDYNKTAWVQVRTFYGMTPHYHHV